MHVHLSLTAQINDHQTLLMSGSKPLVKVLSSFSLRFPRAMTYRHLYLINLKYVYMYIEILYMSQT